MGWQDYTAWAIVAAACCAAGVWAWRRLCGRRRGGCASCGAAQCPMKKIARK
ncbi:MAG TPA: hypothetical protein H9920_02290 [Candidatus Alistipes faecavium]|uniref:hypothetical protein n=1 Tax=uncultured Alistipes sp. TaxID=538949 RepID=UPI001F8B7E06|nr:hypothetical protein [uncultured Alistipes sp.]HJA96538.1 hypothetical protein [Candidatus Alistipes faecavium]